MAAEMALLKPISFKPETGTTRVAFKIRHSSKSRVRCLPKMSSASPSQRNAVSKKGKTAIKETLLTPRFYTTDFEAMEALFNPETNKNLNMQEFEALLQEFRNDYNQTHFVRDKEFKEAADKLQGPLRSIFVEFLERSCTAEFSGFLLYKEIARRLKVRRHRWPEPSLFNGQYVLRIYNK